jgi:hypothetical protein
MTDFDDAHSLRKEILGLFDRIQTIRREIASIRKPGDEQDRFATMSDELDAIVESTETATNSIMENAEAIDEAIMGVRKAIDDPEIAARLDAIPDHIGGIFEACSFQDITGQRITKVVKTLQFIETRVNALISVWGEEALSSVDARDEFESLPPDDERRLLNGPQLKGHGTSQADVDSIMKDGAATPEPTPRKASGAEANATKGDAPPAQKAAPPPSKPTDGDKKTSQKTAPPAPAPAPAPSKDDGEPGGGLDQNDIDKLFG